MIRDNAMEIDEYMGVADGRCVVTGQCDADCRRMIGGNMMQINEYIGVADGR